MKCLFIICVFTFCYNYAFGAVALIPPDKDHPGSCYYKSTGSMKKNEEKTIDNCTRATCLSDGTIELATCGVISSPCPLSGYDNKLPYPDCCPKPKC